MNSIFNAYRFHCDEPSDNLRHIRNESGLRWASRNAAPGMLIKVRGTRYDDDVEWRADGTKEEPIWIDFTEAKMQNMVFTINADWVRVTHGDWRNSQITIEGDNNRVTRCHFHHGDPGGNSAKFSCAAMITGKGSYNRIDHCLVENWEGRGIRHVKMQRGAIRNVMDHNHLWNMSDGKFNNGREAMQIGAGRNEIKLNDMDTLLAFNLIENFQLESEAISIKANGNSIIGNVLMSSKKSSIVCRSGSRNVFGGNHVVDARGITIYGDNNRVVDNTLLSSGAVEIGIRSGDCTAEQIQQSRFPGGHPAARYTIVAYNEVDGNDGIEIGARGRGSREYYDEQWIAATNTGMYENLGKVTFVDPPKGRHQGTNELDDYKGPRFDREPVTPFNVGLGAIDIFCEDKPSPPPPPPPPDPILQLIDRVDNLEARVAKLEAKSHEHD